MGVIFGTVMGVILGTVMGDIFGTVLGPVSFVFRRAPRGSVAARRAFVIGAPLLRVFGCGPDGLC
jgi:hypothetical protein